MVNISETAILEALSKAKEGVWKYYALMEKLPITDVSKDSSFQRSFNHYYKIRQRSLEWYSVFYNLLEQSKDSDISFDLAIKHIYSKLGRIEPSFSSKLVATINPELPVWDRYVLENLKIKWTYTGKPDARLDKAVTIYRRIFNEIDSFKKTETTTKIISIFNSMYPSLASKVTKTKKIDFTLWQLRA